MPELQMEILTYLPPKEVCNLSRCSKAMYQIATDNGLWRYFYQRFFDLPGVSTLGDSKISEDPFGRGPFSPPLLSSVPPPALIPAVTPPAKGEEVASPRKRGLKSIFGVFSKKPKKEDKVVPQPKTTATTTTTKSKSTNKNASIEEGWKVKFQKAWAQKKEERAGWERAFELTMTVKCLPQNRPATPSDSHFAPVFEALSRSHQKSGRCYVQ